MTHDIALHQVAPELMQPLPSSEVLGSLRHHAQAKVVPEIDCGSNDCCVFAVRGDVSHKRAVDLELINWQPRQVGEGRVAGPEIVDGHSDAEGANASEYFDGSHRIGHHG